MQTLSASQASPEIPINENFQTLDAVAVYGNRQPVTTGLTWGYYGGRWSGVSVADGTLTLTNGSANYIVVARATGAITVSTAATNWDNPGAYARVYKITAAGGAVSATEDHRAGLYGVLGPASVASAVSADRGDADATLVHAVDAPTQRWATALTANRTVTLSATGAVNGAKFRAVRTGLGAFTLDVGGLKTIPSATAAWVDVEHDGTAWRLTGYGTL